MHPGTAAPGADTALRLYKRRTGPLLQPTAHRLHDLECRQRGFACGLPPLAAANTRNPLAISGLTVAAGLPWIMIGPLSGAIVDRVDRRKVMVLAQVSRAGLLGAAALYVFLGGESIIALYGLLILVGVGETFFNPAGLALLPGLVRSSQLDTANSRLYGTQILAQPFLGPPLGGWLFAFAAWAPLGVDALSFLAAGMFVLGLPRGSGRKASEHRRTGLLTETVEDIRWVWRHSVLRAFMVGAGAVHFATAAGLSVLVLLAQDRFALTGFGFGLTIGRVGCRVLPGLRRRPLHHCQVSPGRSVRRRIDWRHGRFLSRSGVRVAPTGRVGIGSGGCVGRAVRCCRHQLSPVSGA